MLFFNAVKAKCKFAFVAVFHCFLTSIIILSACFAADLTFYQRVSQRDSSNLGIDFSAHIASIIQPSAGDNRHKEVYHMGRHTHKRMERGMLDHFDKVYMEWPEMPHIATVVAMPLKTIFINSTAAYWANIDKVIFDMEELISYFPEVVGWDQG